MCCGPGEIIAPLANVLGTEWLRNEIWVVPGIFGQRSVHLGSADAELARQHQEEYVRVSQGGRGVSTRDQRVVEISGQVIQRLCPSISLIADKTEQYTERMLLPSALAVDGDLQRREQWRGIGKSGGLDEKPRHFDLGVRARLEPPVKLQHSVFFKKHRAI